MEYHHRLNHATKPRGLGMVRFFGGKQRGRRDDRGRDGPPEAEARTDATTKKAVDSRERDGSAGPSAVPKSKNGALKSPTSRGREKNVKAAAATTGGGARFASPKSRPSKSPRQSPKPDKRTATASPTKAAPASILHKSHYKAAAKAPPPPPPTNASPLQVYSMGGNPRVRFMSAEESVASTQTSQVHLMAGANSVASSSAMSSSGGPNNAYDRVLSMVTSEEHVRLNAMGMAVANPDPRGAKQHQQNTGTNDRFSKVDAKAKAAVEAIPGSASKEDDLGLSPPKRGDLAPIDMDTGLEIVQTEAPIDADTGLELGGHLGEGILSPIDTDTGMEIQYSPTEGEDEHHDTNDEALKKMKRLDIKHSRRVRSYDDRMKQNRNLKLAPSNGSDPERFSRSDSDQGPPRPNKKADRPAGRKGAKGKKKFWGGSKDLDSEEWVDFDKQGSPPGNLAAF
ncbi:hypothetical protein ACHAXT_008081 [Thalassiosira profunda]